MGNVTVVSTTRTETSRPAARAIGATPHAASTSGDKVALIEVDDVGVRGPKGASGDKSLVETLPNPPADPKPGAMWWNASNGSTYIWYEDAGSGQWVQVNAGPASSLVLTPEMFDAAGDGVTDDLSKLQAMVDEAAASGREIAFQTKSVYKISDTLFIPSGVIIRGNGATLDGSGRAAATALGQVYGVRLLGGIGSDVALTASAVRGAKVITVASTAGVAVNDILLVKSDEVWPPGAVGTSNRKGALHKVKSVDSGTQITLWDGLFFSFDSAMGAEYAKLTPVVGVTISDLKVVMGGVGKGHNGIGIDYADDCWLMNCTVRDAEDCGVRPAYCFGGGVIGGEYIGSTNPGDSSNNLGTTGYGVVVGKGCRNFTVENAVFRNNRHSIAGGGVHPAIFARIVGNTLYGGTKEFDLECHEDCTWWEISQNTITGCNDVTLGCGGIMIRGQHCVVSENKVISPKQNGIFVHSYDVNPNGQVGCKVLNNTIENSRLSAINVAGDQAVSMCHDIEVKGNTIRNCTGEGVAARMTNGLTISGNIIEDMVGATVSGIRLVGSATAGDNCTDFIISDNRIARPGQFGINLAYAYRGTMADNNILGGPTYPIILQNCDQVAVTGGHIKSAGTNLHGIRVDSSTKIMLRPGVLDGGGGATSSAGVSILGTSSDISVIGGLIFGYQYPVRATGTVDYIMAVGINGRGCNVAIDLAAATNKVVADNL